jgi:hypothetical protein
VAPNKTRSQPTAAGRRFRRHQLDLAEGGKLVLHGDGSITQTDAAGETTRRWAIGDPDWARYAIRFGLQPQPETVVPESRRAAEPRPQDG